ncbi:WD and tetratricopeptide repeats protein 1-like [Glandiceps talaboti]
MADHILYRLRQRETAVRHCCGFQRSLHVNKALLPRLNLEAELQGHTGCVNCLEWNEKGNLLASGSDDLNTIIWEPMKHKQLCSIRTGHHGNVFSVKFLPDTNDRIIATAAADCKVRVHDINIHETTTAFSCHAGRVKRLAVAPTVPYMFWSAGEDGTIRQFDLRSPHTCNDHCGNVLINLNAYIGNHAEAKCVAINPLRTEMLAVGANDPYIRIYDIRMLSPHSVRFSSEERLGASWHTPAPDPDPNGELPKGCVQYYIAGHLPIKQNEYNRRFRTLVSTYVTFGPDGRELLVNLGGEQIYLFDVTKNRMPRKYNLEDYRIHPPASNGVVRDVAEALSSNGTAISGSVANGVSRHISQTNGIKIREESQPKRVSLCGKRKGLPPRAEALKKRANEVFAKQQWTDAINLYNQALSIAPNSAVLFANRAAAYMKRKWDGDMYAGLRDCHNALSLDITHCKAHFRLAKCLFELTWMKEALDCLRQFTQNFPEYAKNETFEQLDRDICAALYAKTDAENEAEKAFGTNRRRQRETQSEHEKTLRSNSFDYDLRFCGHCNTTTDIKEANFFGSNGQYIVAGSDDGSFFIWEKSTTNLVRVLRGDESIVNCLQPHPSHCFLATSGIDPVVRLWSPRPEEGGQEDDRHIEETDSAATANQKRMNADPLEVMLMNMGYRITGISEGSDDENPENAVQCRPS